MTTRLWVLLAVPLLTGCATVPVGSSAPSDDAPINAVARATSLRGREDLATNTPPALGSFYRRVWAQEFDRFARPLRNAPFAASVPEQLNAQTVARWQSALNDGWKNEDLQAVREAAGGVVTEAAPMRDALKILLRTQVEPPEAIAAAISIGQILVELVQEAELLALRDSREVAAFEEFIARYPDGPYSGSVLFALGTIHQDRRELAEAKSAFDRMLERFPTHALAQRARERLSGP